MRVALLLSLITAACTSEPSARTDSAAAAGDDPNYRLVFETDGSRVLRYRGCKLPQVRWVEGCS